MVVLHHQTQPHVSDDQEGADDDDDDDATPRYSTPGIGEEDMVSVTSQDEHLQMPQPDQPQQVPQQRVHHHNHHGPPDQEDQQRPQDDSMDHPETNINHELETGVAIAHDHSSPRQQDAPNEHMVIEVNGTILVDDDMAERDMPASGDLQPTRVSEHVRILEALA